ncbi:MAG: protein kinase domain-containing protein, partial [Planctomycetota bacterium]
WVPEEDWNGLIEQASVDSQRLTDLLVERGFLTAFQQTALLAGRADSLRIGNYDLLDRLGAGGMGTVYRARHRRMKRIVALKVLAANLSRDPLFVKRFQREVETLACLGHPNIVMAYDADEAPEGHFLVMEFVQGNDLAGLVKSQGPFSAAQAVECMRQAAVGLAYAHSRDIIHRDIKPHNLLLDRSGMLKIADLGLARLNHDGDSAHAVTAPGGVFGTADYMSPEQAVDSTVVDHRADIYSLGCTLHYLLAGRPPYEGPNIMAILLKHRDAVIPSLMAVNAAVPAELQQLFEHMLAKSPDARPAAMDEVATRLREIGLTLRGESVEFHQGTEDSSAGLEITAELAASDLPSRAQGDEPQAVTMDFCQTTQVVGLGEARNTSPPSLEGLRVLVVEPSRSLATIVAKYLITLNMEPLQAVATGQEALEWLKSNSVSVVIAALHLSDMTGRELATTLRRQFSQREPAFLLLTSERVEDVQAGKSPRPNAAAFDRIQTLQKPFSLEQLREALQTALQPPTPAARRRVDRSRLQVLLVDDSTTARLHVRRILEGLGFRRITEVADGAYGIVEATRQPYDLIISDYNMPLMNGLAMVSYFKNNPGTAHIPILMVTTETTPEILDPLRKLGVVEIVEKAFPPAVVAPLLDTFF